MSIARAAVALAIVGCVSADTDSEERAEAAQSEQRKGGGVFQLLVTVDWEGADLRDENLRAMEDLRARFPGLKLVHFLNAAYYTRARPKPEVVTASINRVLRPGDEHGLHLHGWKRLFEAAGVTFRNTPTFKGRPAIVPVGPECVYDCGIDVPISVYTADELQQVVRYSVDLLEGHGFERARSFRAGGWMLRPQVLEAIAAEGFAYDHSPVATPFLWTKLHNVPIWGWLNEIWPTITDVSQPYTVVTATTPIIEVPDNGALAGYTSAAQMVEMFQHNKAVYLRDPTKNVVLEFGFHQELSKRDLPALSSGLQQIYDIAKKEGLTVESVTSDDISVTPPTAIASPR